jgi:hypothetical protein
MTNRTGERRVPRFATLKSAELHLPPSGKSVDQYHEIHLSVVRPLRVRGLRRLGAVGYPFANDHPMPSTSTEAVEAADGQAELTLPRPQENH